MLYRELKNRTAEFLWRAIERPEHEGPFSLMRCDSCGSQAPLDDGYVCELCSPVWKFDENELKELHGLINSLLRRFGFFDDVEVDFGHGEFMSDPAPTPQQRVYAAVRWRGYRDGYAPGVFAARQIMKATEELAELAQLLIPVNEPEPIWVERLRQAGMAAKVEFDKGIRVGSLRTRDFLPIDNWPDAINEAADVIVTMLSMAEAMHEAAASADVYRDVVETAVSKAAADVKRGVR